jgi:integrase
VSRTRNAAPSYIPHAKSGRGRLQWYDSTGTRREKLLPGPFGSPESLAAKARLELELAASSTHEPVAGPESLSVAELLCAYLDFAEKHYRGSDGSPTDEVRHIKAAIQHTQELYADMLATGFGPLALKAVRQRFVEQGWCRKTVNARIERVRRIFKWAVAEELVPPAVYQALAAVNGLERGRTDAKESEPVAPVDDAVVDATLPHLNRHVRGLIEFQRLTGCRPGEACRIRRGDLDMSGPVWLYKPAGHKTAWKGKTRTVAIGPQGTDAAAGVLHARRRRLPVLPRPCGRRVPGRTAGSAKAARCRSHTKRNEWKRVKNPKRRRSARRANVSLDTASRTSGRNGSTGGSSGVDGGRKWRRARRVSSPSASPRRGAGGAVEPRIGGAQHRRRAGRGGWLGSSDLARPPPADARPVRAGQADILVRPERHAADPDPAAGRTRDPRKIGAAPIPGTMKGQSL